VTVILIVLTVVVLVPIAVLVVVGMRLIATRE
jgi:hypothetical protein